MVNCLGHNSAFTKVHICNGMYSLIHTIANMHVHYFAHMHFLISVTLQINEHLTFQYCII